MDTVFEILGDAFGSLLGGLPWWVLLILLLLMIALLILLLSLL